ncbi:MAG: hypothetical protein WKG01_14860 [Kofleriaceae bacterium]
MARGVARAPSQNAYRGALGRTQTTGVHVAVTTGDLIPVQAHTTIDAVSDPELADRLLSDDPARALNMFRIDGGEPIRVSVPVLYHDPAAEILVLVLAEASCHRELDERIRIYERLRADDATIPAYVKDLPVVYGAAGLRAHLEKRADQALETVRRAELAHRETELERARSEVTLAKTELVRHVAELERARGELARERTEIERLRSEARNRVIAAAQQPADHQTVVTSAPSSQAERDTDLPTKPITKTAFEDLDANLSAMTNGASDDDDLKTGVVDALAIEDQADEEHAVGGDDEVMVEFDEEPTGATPGAAPATATSELAQTELVELPLDPPRDDWFEQAAQQEVSTFTVEHGVIRLALVVGDQLARGLGGPLDVRVLLHRAPSYPLIVLVLGPPAALRTPNVQQLATVMLDISSDHDRQVLVALVKRFELVIDIVVRRKRIRRVQLTAPLAENVGYILRGAEDHLRAIATEGELAPERARELVSGAGYDLLGSQHPEASEFRDDKLAQLETAQQVRRAISMARRFARPAREDYLVCTRGFSLPRWRELRRKVLERAVEWGIWMGPDLAQVAVSEGLARSRRDLIAKVDRGFETLRRHPTALDIDDEAAEDNAKAIAEEASALGVELPRPRTGTIASDAMSAVSGSIGGNTPARGFKQPKSVDELIAELDDRQLRVAAALELCERGEARAAAKVIAAVTKMSRAEAVRVLGMAVKFGDAAKQPLLEGLRSSKAFLRHGCALALALLRTEDGAQAVIELLLTEPTEIWREVARAIGQVGPTALLPLASTFGRRGESASPAMAERVAWAMAHVAVRGGKAAIETMARGQSVVAPVARHALDLHASAANDHIRVNPSPNGSQPGREVTVNRAFSRRFFEALEAGLPEAGAPGLVDLEASGPMEMLDEADLIDDDEAELDESDLIR